MYQRQYNNPFTKQPTQQSKPTIAHSNYVPPQQINPIQRTQQPIKPPQLQTNVQIQNPYAQPKGPLYLFQQEEALNKQHNLKFKEEANDDDEDVDDNDDNDEQQDEEDDDEQEEEEEEEEEEDDDNDDNDQNHELQQEGNEKYLNNKDDLKNPPKLDNKYKSKDQIKGIMVQIDKVNRDLDKLDELIDTTLVMSRIKFEQDTLLNMSMSSDMSYSQYLVEFEQFKQTRQSQQE